MEKLLYRNRMIGIKRMNEEEKDSYIKELEEKNERLEGMIKIAQETLDSIADNIKSALRML